MASRIVGRVKFYSAEKGYGFLQPDDGGVDVFVHVSQLRKCGLQELTKGSKVHFDAETRDDGRMRATTVEIVS